MTTENHTQPLMPETPSSPYSPSAPCPIKDEGEETTELGKPEPLSETVPTGSMERLAPLHEAAINEERVTLTSGLRYDLPDSRRVEVWNVKGRDDLGFRIFRLDAKGDTSLLKFGLSSTASRALMSGLVEKLAPELLSEHGRSSTATSVSPQTSPEASPATTGKGPMEENENYRQNDRLLHAVNSKTSTWLDFPEQAGTKGYAERAAEWLSASFSPERYEAVESAGWWYAEEVPSEGRVTDKQGGLPVTPKPDFLTWWKTVWNLNPYRHIDSNSAEQIWNAARSPALPLPLSEETKKDL